jgi:hypothetical protein
MGGWGLYPVFTTHPNSRANLTVLETQKRRGIYVCGNKLAASEIWVKIEAMPYILEHLTSLRQEITDLRNMNARFTGKGSDTQIDQSAVEMRANRLAEIKKELSQMLNRPEDPAVWWEKGGRRNRVA